MSTKAKLAKALSDAHAPPWMIKKAIDGGYDDFESESATPIMDLVNDLTQHGFDSPALTKVADDAKAGTFDATKEESDAWWAKHAGDFLDHPQQ
jgi:hypothetical protein